MIAECAWLLRQAGQWARWEPRAVARQPLLRLRTHAKEQLVAQQAVGRALHTVSGIGRWGALVLRAERGDLQWLRNGKAFVRYCG